MLVPAVFAVLMKINLCLWDRIMATCRAHRLLPVLSSLPKTGVSARCRGGQVCAPHIPID